MSAIADNDDEITGIYDLLAALEDVLQHADPERRAILARTIDRYHEDFPEDFHWAISTQAPALLHYLMTSIDGACRLEQSKPRAVLHVVLKPEVPKK